MKKYRFLVSYPHMIHPDFPGGKPTMFICGNDEGAKKFVREVWLGNNRHRWDRRF